MKFFIGNWKMFGVPRSINILNKINKFIKKDSNRNKYKVIVAPPFTLIETFAKKFKKSSIKIGAQNCYYKDGFASDTAAISSYMLKKVNAKYVIIGHSDNRAEGDDNKILKAKLNHALKNNLKVIFCIGENSKDKIKRKTYQILSNQLSSVLERKMPQNNIIVAYEPIWSIGTGNVPSNIELEKITKKIKEITKKIFNKQKQSYVLYGGSVDGKNIKKINNISSIDGFLIGGASKTSKKFIDIIKNYYR